VALLATGEYQQQAATLGARLEQRLRSLVGHGVKAVRVRGLWAGVDLDPRVATGRQMCEWLLERGVLAKDTHGATIRLAPPLTIEPAELDWLIDQIEAVLAAAR
jgi:ornithine--oxo-acid transaminase